MDRHTLRQWRLFQQHLTDPADKFTVCRHLNGLQAQFLSYTRHALAIRCAVPLAEDWGQGLVKTWSVRGTMHVFGPEDLPLFLHRDRTHFLREVDRFADDPFASGPRKEFFAGQILAALDTGISDREELRTLCRAAGMTEQEEQSVFNSWGGLLRAMAEAGLICYEVSEKKRFRRCPPFTPMERESARLEQARRYFTHFGPATAADAAYYFGTTKKAVKCWLEKLPVSSVEVEGRTYFYLGSCPAHLPEVPPCVLLAGFDQLMLGYEKKDSIFLPEAYLRGIFNRAGIVMPALLLGGIAAGRWGVKNSVMTVTAFRPLTEQEEQSVRREAERWFPAVRRIVFEK